MKAVKAIEEAIFECCGLSQRIVDSYCICASYLVAEYEVSVGGDTRERHHGHHA